MIKLTANLHSPEATSRPPHTLAGAHEVLRTTESRNRPVRRIVARVGGSPGAAKFRAVRQAPRTD